MTLNFNLFSLILFFSSLLRSKFKTPYAISLSKHSDDVSTSRKKKFSAFACVGAFVFKFYFECIRVGVASLSKWKCSFDTCCEAFWQHRQMNQLMIDNSVLWQWICVLKRQCFYFCFSKLVETNSNIQIFTLEIFFSTCEIMKKWFIYLYFSFH